MTRKDEKDDPKRFKLKREAESGEQKQLRMMVYHRRDILSHVHRFGTYKAYPGQITGGFPGDNPIVGIREKGEFENFISLNGLNWKLDEWDHKVTFTGKINIEYKIWLLLKSITNAEETQPWIHAEAENLMKIASTWKSFDVSKLCIAGFKDQLVDYNDTQKEEYWDES